MRRPDAVPKDEALKLRRASEYRALGPENAAVMKRCPIRVQSRDGYGSLGAICRRSAGPKSRFSSEVVIPRHQWAYSKSTEVPAGQCVENASLTRRVIDA